MEVNERELQVPTLLNCKAMLYMRVDKDVHNFLVIVHEEMLKDEWYFSMGAKMSDLFSISDPDTIKNSRMELAFPKCMMEHEEYVEVQERVRGEITFQKLVEFHSAMLGYIQSPDRSSEGDMESTPRSAFIRSPSRKGTGDSDMSLGSRVSGEGSLYNIGRLDRRERGANSPVNPRERNKANWVFDKTKARVESPARSMEAGMENKGEQSKVGPNITNVAPLQARREEVKRDKSPREEQGIEHKDQGERKAASTTEEWNVRELDEMEALKAEVVRLNIRLRSRDREVATASRLSKKTKTRGPSGSVKSEGRMDKFKKAATAALEVLTGTKNTTQGVTEPSDPTRVPLPKSKSGSKDGDNMLGRRWEKSRERDPHKGSTSFMYNEARVDEKEEDMMYPRISMGS